MSFSIRKITSPAHCETCSRTVPEHYEIDLDDRVVFDLCLACLCRFRAVVRQPNYPAGSKIETSVSAVAASSVFDDSECAPCGEDKPDYDVWEENQLAMEGVYPDD